MLQLYKPPLAKEKPVNPLAELLDVARPTLPTSGRGYGTSLVIRILLVVGRYSGESISHLKVVEERYSITANVFIG
jgi:hypothetical protein